MFGVPLWLWCAAALVAFILLTGAAMRSYRRGLAERFTARLAANHLQIEVVAWDDRVVALKLPQIGSVPVDVRDLGARVRDEQKNAGLSNDEAERAVFDRLARSLLDADGNSQATMGTHGDRIRPRIVSAALLESLRAGSIVSRPLDGTPLHVVYVFDTPDSAQYVSDADRDALGVDIDDLHALALKNLRATFSDAPLRGVIDEKRVALVRLGDTFDAARLLLVPENLRDGEAVAAFVPERDGIVLAPVPADGDWSAFVSAAKQSFDGPCVHDGPILVTTSGFRAIEI
jgi:hypothetical protein